MACVLSIGSRLSGGQDAAMTTQVPTALLAALLQSDLLVTA
jgi:hypothetical protein